MRKYPSKLLLFGEHILLLGGSALAVPVPRYAGYWQEKGEKPAVNIQQKIVQFGESEHLANIQGLDTPAFLQDLKNGLVFESNIPFGYGLGSSGALCAGVYDRYCREKTAELSALKNGFAAMESFFHGSSSGIDPLTSYLEKPLLIQQKTTVSIAETPHWQHPPLVFLIDSELPRQTGALVGWFLEKSRQLDFSELLMRDYLPFHETLLQSWLAADADVFWPNLRQVSQFQFEKFEPMIPPSLHDVWLKSFEGEEILFKICGAGGGGFMLGFSLSMQPVEALAKHFNIVFPFGITS